MAEAGAGSAEGSAGTDTKVLPRIDVDIVSDVMCPWCVVGARYLDTAIAGVKDKARVRVRWHPFLLSPKTPKEGMSMDDYAIMNYGAPMSENTHLQHMRVALSRAGAELGIEFKWADRVYSTITAHRLIEWAGSLDKEGEDGSFANLQHAVSKAVLDAHFCDKANTEDIDVLVACAEKAGLDGAAARKHLLETEEEGTAEVLRLDAQVKRMGIHGVPSWTIKLHGGAGRGVRFSGAQPADDLQDLFESMVETRGA